MIKINTPAFIFIFVIGCLLACEKQQKAEIISISPKCITTQNTCVVKTDLGNFSLLFNLDPVLTETPFELVLVANTQYVINKVTAHMEGKNMFMGKIPLFFKAFNSKIKNIDIEDSKLDTKTDTELINKHEYVNKEFNTLENGNIEKYRQSSLNKAQYRFQATTMLGSCNEENMQWVIFFEIEMITEQKSKVKEGQIKKSTIKDGIIKKRIDKGSIVKKRFSIEFTSKTR